MIEFIVRFLRSNTSILTLVRRLRAAVVELGYAVIIDSQIVIGGRQAKLDAVGAQLGELGDQYVWILRQKLAKSDNQKAAAR